MEEKKPKARREYKDTVFRMLFSDEKNLLSLYNAMTGRSYEDAKELEIVTLGQCGLHGDEERSGIFTGSAHLFVRTSVDEEPEHAAAGSVLYFSGISEVCE